MTLPSEMTDTAPAPIHLASAHDSEELARAELYGLLATLWLAPPGPDLLSQFQVAVTQAPQPGGWLEAPWETLVGAMRATSAEAAIESTSAPERLATPLNESCGTHPTARAGA